MKFEIPFNDLSMFLKNTSDSIQHLVQKIKQEFSPQKIIADDLPPVRACFAQGTLVHLKGITCPIEWVNVGALVLARDEKTGEQGYRRVAKTFVHRDRQIFKVAYATDEGRAESLYTTAEHPFWVKNVGWTEVSNLRPGHILEICDPDGRDDEDRCMAGLETLALSGERWTATVIDVQETEHRFTVYNIEVEDFHTYFVGAHGVFVHNTKGSFTHD